MSNESLTFTRMLLDYQPLFFIVSVIMVLSVAALMLTIREPRLATCPCRELGLCPRPLASPSLPTAWGSPQTPAFSGQTGRPSGCLAIHRLRHSRQSAPSSKGRFPCLFKIKGTLAFTRLDCLELLRPMDASQHNLFFND